jgi:hypothetical protein
MINEVISHRKVLRSDERNGVLEYRNIGLMGFECIIPLLQHSGTPFYYGVLGLSNSLADRVPMTQLWKTKFP